MIRNLRYALKTLSEVNTRRINRTVESFSLLSNRASFNANFCQCRSKKDDTSLFKPVPIQLKSDDMDVGAEITGKAIDKAEMLKILNRFSQKRETRLMCIENGLDSK